MSNTGATEGSNWYDEKGRAVIVDLGSVSKNFSREMIGQGFAASGVEMPPVHFYNPKKEEEQFPWMNEADRLMLLGRYVNLHYVSRGKLTAERGSWNMPVMPGDVTSLSSLSPASLWGGQSHKFPLFFWDVAKFLRGPVEIKEEFYLSPEGDELKYCLDKLAASEFQVVDSEWYSPYQLAYVGFGDGKGFAFTIKPTPFGKQVIKMLLANDQPKVMQNAMFDVPYLERDGFPTNNLLHDTMVAFHCAYPDLREKGLGTLATVFTDRSYYKEEVEFVGTDDVKGQTYCCRDVDATGEALPKILEENRANNTRRGYDTSMSLFEPMKRATVIGMRVHIPRYKAMRKKFLAQADFLEDHLGKMLGGSINCRSPQQVQRLVFDVLKVRGRKRTSKQEVLMDIAASTGSEELKVILTSIIRVRQNRNIVSRYLHDGIFGPDNRVRTDWKLAGTRSGRLASGKMWGEGLAHQTIPENARSIFIPDDGHVFVGFDLAQAEARVVAVLTRDFELLEAMDDGTDIHCLLGSQIEEFGLSYDEMMDLKGYEGGNFRERLLAKKLRHSINYVASWRSIKASINRDYLETGVGVDARTAKMLHQAALEIGPGLPLWWKRVKSQMYAGNGTIENPFGRVRNFRHAGTITDNMHREGVSFFPQSTIADLTTNIIVNVDRAMDYGKRGQVMAHMHDGAFWQVKKEDEEWAKEIIANEGHIPFRVEGTELVIPVDIKAGTNWGAM